MKLRPHLSVAALLMLASSAFAGTTVTEPSPAQPSCVSDWWNGNGLTGQWFGLRPALADMGLTFNGNYYGAFFGVVRSQNGARGFWDDGLQFGADQNFGKLFKIDALNGVKGFASFRYRNPSSDADPNQVVGASSMFSPTNWTSGTQFRVLSFGLELGSASLLPVKDMIVLRGGWLQPQREFVDQPLSKLFLNNAVNSAKGIGGNIPFSSSFSTWGGTLRIKPVEWAYVKGGLFMAYPNATASNNHGLMFQGYAPNPTQNNLMGLLETGVTPVIGAAKLPGKYAAGTYYWGQPKSSFSGHSYFGQYGFYFQADQMVYRAPAKELPAPVGTAKDGKSFKEPVSAEAPKLSDKGLSVFNLVTFAPKYNNLYPFYFQSGFSYTGLIPTRDKDQLLFSVAYGSYSYYNIEALQAKGKANQPNYTMFLEGGYRFALNNWWFVQPFIQYAIKPAGTGIVSNATILGVYTGLNF